MMATDRKWMALAIAEAKKGRGFHLPNPPVGAVVVLDQKVIGRGHHQIFGQAHAEVMALAMAKKNSPNLEQAILYVTLSPCTRHGKTPPCTNLIIDSGIKHVVYAVKDQSDVQAKKVLIEHNIEVKDGILQEQAEEDLKPFFYSQQTKLPYVIGKIAMTLDGMIATKTYHSQWITSNKTRQWANRRRSNQQAILVGINTILHDNPHLSVRDKGYHSPTIVVCDNTGLLQKDFNIFKSQTPKLIFTNHKYDEHEFSNTKFIVSPQKLFDPRVILETLFSHNIHSVLIEGGSFTLNTFLKAKLVNSLEIYLAPKITGDPASISAFNFQQISAMDKTINFTIQDVKKIDQDLFIKLEPLCSQE